MADKWTNPKRRSFQEIRQDLVAKLTSITDSKGHQLITDVSEGNILIIILSLFAGIADHTGRSPPDAVTLYARGRRRWRLDRV